MGRRSLKPVAADLDLSRHLIMRDDLPNPWDQAAVFGSVAPLEVEVGSGKGLFLTNAALANSAHHFLGIEMARKYAKFSAGRLAKKELDNAVMVSGDALAVFRELIPNNSLHAVHVYFPDPWWKDRHRKRRVLQEPLMKDIQRTLIPGCTLHFWTDVEEYYLSSLELFAEHTELIGPELVEEKPAESDMDYLTHFERRKRKDDLPIYRCKFHKPK